MRIALLDGVCACSLSTTYSGLAERRLLLLQADGDVLGQRACLTTHGSAPDNMQMPQPMPCNANAATYCALEAAQAAGLRPCLWRLLIISAVCVASVQRALCACAASPIKDRCLCANTLVVDASQCIRGPCTRRHGTLLSASALCCCALAHTHTVLYCIAPMAMPAQYLRVCLFGTDTPPFIPNLL